MNVGTIFLFVSLFLISPFSRASIEILSHSVQTYKPEKEASSPLKSFRLEVLKKKVVLKFDPNNPSFQTDVKMIVETQEISSVEDFAIVQFIKGCIYKSKSINGELRKEISSYRKHQGEFKPFIHKEAFSDVETNFMFHEDFAKNLLKLLNKKGILNVGGPKQTVFNFAKKNNPQVKPVIAKKKLGKKFPLKQSMNINKYLKIVKK